MSAAVEDHDICDVNHIKLISDFGIHVDNILERVLHIINLLGGDGLSEGSIGDTNHAYGCGRGEEGKQQYLAPRSA
jgi:hypothetical protein